MNLEERLLQKAEDLEWFVSVEKDYWEFEKYSPAGEDFVFCVTGTDIVGCVQEYYDSFDPEEHIMEMVEAKRNGLSGVPSVRILCDDADAIDEMIYELLQAFIEVESEYLDELADAEEEED